MREIMDGPRAVDIVVRQSETEMTLISERTEDKSELMEAITIFRVLHGPTDLDLEYGLAIKDTPDGEMSRHVVIWHARWKHGEASRLPLLKPVSLQ